MLSVKVALISSETWWFPNEDASQEQRRAYTPHGCHILSNVMWHQHRSSEPKSPYNLYKVSYLQPSLNVAGEYFIVFGWIFYDVATISVVCVVLASFVVLYFTQPHPLSQHVWLFSARKTFYLS